jgi:hypothetical protein
MIEVVKMSSIAISNFRRNSNINLTTNVKLAISYAAAHLTAFSSVGFFYLLGLFDVGFLSHESLAVKFMNYLISTIS